MKKIIYAVIAVLIISFIYTAYNKGADENVVGVVLPLTGKFASISEDIQNAIILASEKSGNKEISFVFEDSAGEPQKAVSAITNLIVNRKAQIVISGTGSTANIAMSKIAEEYGVPFFAVTSTPELMGKKDHTYTLQPSVVKEVETMFELVKAKGYKSIAVLYDGTSDSLTAGAKHFGDLAASQGIKTPVFEPYAQDGDQNTTNLKVKSAQPDLVYILGVDKAVGPVVKKLKEIGFEGDIAGFSGLESSVFLSVAGKASENVFLTSVPFSCDSLVSKEYCSEYMRRFNGRTPQQYGAFVYNLVNMILVENGCIASKCYMNQAYQQSITGPFGFNDTGDIDAIVPLVLKRISDGQFVIVE